MKVHLTHGVYSWCQNVGKDGSTEDPRRATCSECLRKAAEYGAAAAMRCAAVEAGGARDPELEAERDEALRRLNTLGAELEKRGAFFCNGCDELCATRDRAVQAGFAGWCKECVPPGAGS